MGSAAKWYSALLRHLMLVVWLLINLTTVFQLHVPVLHGVKGTDGSEHRIRNDVERSVLACSLCSCMENMRRP
jgi:hypothetical protein